MTGDLAHDLRLLRTKFDNLLVAEVNHFGGIPSLFPEEVELREALAALLQKYDVTDSDKRLVRCDICDQPVDREIACDDCLTDLAGALTEISNPAEPLRAAFHEGWLAMGHMGGTLSEEECWQDSFTRKLADTKHGWQPIETAPRETKCWFWIVPKDEDETFHDTSHKPIFSRIQPCAWIGKYGCWGALDKATHWMPFVTPAAPEGDVGGKGLAHGE